MATITINDLSGGTNQNTSPDLIGQTENILIINCTQDETGNIAHRLGTDLVGATTATAAAVQGHVSYNKSDGTHTLLRFVGGDLESFDGTSTWTVESAGVVDSASTVEAVNYLDKIYFIGSGDTEYLKTWDGSSVATVTGNITGKILAVGNNRIVVAGDPTNVRRAKFSDIGTDTFSNDGYIDFDGVPTAMTSLGESSPFIGFTEEDMYVFDPDRGSSYPLPGFGCTSQRSLKVLQGHAIWLSRTGFYRFSQTEGYPVKISTPIENDITGDALFNRIAGSSFETAAAGLYKNKYFVSVGNLSSTVGGETLNDCVLVYDLPKQTWCANTYTTGGIGSVFTSWIDGDDNKVLIAGSRDTKSTYKLEVAGVYTDDNSTGTTVAVTGLYRTKEFLFGGSGNKYAGPEIVKHIQQGYMRLYAPAAMTIKYSRDGATTYSAWTTTNTTSAGYNWHYDRLNPPHDEKFNSLKLEFSGTGGWKLYEWALDLISGTNLEKIPV